MNRRPPRPERGALAKLGYTPKLVDPGGLASISSLSGGLEAPRGWRPVLDDRSKNDWWPREDLPLHLRA